MPTAKYKLWFENGEWFFWHPVKGCRYVVKDFWFTWSYLFNLKEFLNFFMPTKFIVLWLQTVFIFSENGKEEESELVLQAEKLNSLEQALNFYNQKVSDPVNAQVMILVPLKDFNRSANKT